MPAGPYRAGVIEENESDVDRPRIEGGTVMWRVIQGRDPGPDAPPEAIVAEMTTDSNGFRATLTIKPVRDAAGGPTVAFGFEGGYPAASIMQVGLPELRNLGVDRGIPLFGAIAATDRGFVVTLSSSQADGEQNVRLLTTRPWIDMPARLQDGRRVTVAFEKGTAVRDMLRSALRLWRMPWLP